MSRHVRAGMIFGQLTVAEIILGKTRGKPKARCICACGRSHTTATTQLISGKSKKCKSCSNRLPPGEAEFRKRFDGYKGNARHRGREFALIQDQFRKLHDAPCTYCGLYPAKGVDRKDNARDYIPENCVPCCKQCNYAKRALSAADFLAWVVRIAVKQGFSL